MTHRQELAETIYDDDAWNPPDRSIVATAIAFCVDASPNYAREVLNE